MANRTFAFMAIHPLYEDSKKSNKTYCKVGKYNGYVGILEGSTGINDYTDWEMYDYANDYILNVHGGVTFDGNFNEKLPIIPLTDIPVNWHEYRIIGFDCGHCDDNEDNCPFEYVKEQTLDMQKQIENQLDNPYTGDCGMTPVKTIVEDNNLISNGKHTLSGVGTTAMTDEWEHNDIEVNLFCIDGKTYGAYIDPNDGYRSYGVIQECPSEEYQYNFPPQEVIVTNKTIKGNDRYFAEDKHLLVITDATNGKEILVVGTDYSEDYYPCALFNYSPENLEVNQGK